MKKLLIGGSPCTHWSIAQTKNRETKAEGVGWELFKCYLTAKEKFQPDYFLYENNQSAAQPIKDQISEELGEPLHYINSSLVSGQSRKRFYVHNFGDIGLPEDRGIVIGDILDTEDDEVHYELVNVSKSKTKGGAYRGRWDLTGTKMQRLEIREDSKSNTLTTVTKDYQVAIPVRVGDIGSGGQGQRVYSAEGKSCTLRASAGGQGGNTGLYTVPVRIGDIGDKSQSARVLSVQGKSCTLTSGQGGRGARTGLYAVPVKIGDLGNQSQTGRIFPHEGKSCTLMAGNGGKECTGLYSVPVKIGDMGRRNQGYNIYSPNGKSTTILSNGGGLASHTEAYAVPLDNSEKEKKEKRSYRVHQPNDNKEKKIEGIHTVVNGQIETRYGIQDINLPDGDYIIRKLKPVECERLQTLPDGYTEGISNTQRYKCIGNGWTAEVIKFILSHMDIDKDEELVVLSMFDGIATGRYVLEQLGFTNVKYYAYEIDPYAIKVAKKNYPDIIECGDVFQVMEDDWDIDSLEPTE